MQALDTNVLVRFLVQDDAKQVAVVNRLFATAEEHKQQFHVSLLVVLELVWVLEAVYKVSRSDLLDSFNELLSMPVLRFESQSTVRAFVSASRDNSFDLSDLLIGQSGLDAECSHTVTFDKKAAKSPLFEKL